jgi:hypothetical protein
VACRANPVRIFEGPAANLLVAGKQFRPIFHARSRLGVGEQAITDEIGFFALYFKLGTT